MNTTRPPDPAANQPSPRSPAVGRTADTWWIRNWIRVLVAACCGVGVLFVGGIASIVVGSLSVVRSSGACQEAVVRAEAAPAVVQALGEPLKVGWLVNGTLDPGHSAEITVPVTGPRGKARIEIVASKASGAWVFSTLTVTINATGARISLVESGPPARPTPLPK